MRNLVEGDTKPIDIALYDGEGASRTAVDGSGLTVALVLTNRQGGLVPTAGKVAWLVQASGTVRYSPDAEDFKAAGSPYEARCLVTDANGDVASYPNGEADRWIVRK